MEAAGQTHLTLLQSEDPWRWLGALPWSLASSFWSYWTVGLEPWVWTGIRGPLRVSAHRPCGSVGRTLVRGVVAVAGTTEEGETGLCFSLLGPLQVTRCGERLSLGGRQQRAVLALLLAESGKVVSVGRLGDALWGEETPNGFVTTVQTYVFHLRQVLEPDRGRGAHGRILVTEPGGYRLDAAGSIVDTAIFEHSVHAGRDALARHAYEEASAELERALGLWRGAVLADVGDLGFVEPVAARLETMRMIAQGLRIEAELALGRHASTGAGG